jgi:hypothetical protein
MGELLDDADIQFPKTVTACHAEIRRLSELLESSDSILEKKDDEIADLEKQIEAKDQEIGDIQSELDEVEEKGTVEDQYFDSAIHAFLDECERVGPLRYDVPQSDRAQRAIVRLHDLVGRVA